MEDVLAIPSVTGVDLNLRIAGPGARSYAFIIDWHIRVLGAAAWFLTSMLVLFGTVTPDDADTAQSTFAFWVVTPSLAIYFLYHPILEIVMAGRTPGKRIAGVRIVRTDGAIPGIGAILIRNVFRLIDSLPFVYCFGLAMTLFTEHSVRIGDLAAGTLLVYDEDKDRGLDRLSGVAVGRLGIEQAELVRDLIDRWHGLRLETRTDLARKLLARLGEPDIPSDDAGLLAALERRVLPDHDQS